MNKQLAIVISLLFAAVLAINNEESTTTTISGCSVDDPNNMSVSCQGVRMVRSLVQRLLDDTAKRPIIEVMRGVTLVQLKDASRDSRNLKSNSSPFNKFIEFLRGRELRINLPNLVPDSLSAAVRQSLPLIIEGRKTQHDQILFPFFN